MPVIMSEDGSRTIFSLTLNATDLEGDTLTWSIDTAANQGTAGITPPTTGNSTGVTYMPNANYFGSDSFVVKVDDGNGDSNTITVNVTVQPVNDAPEIGEGPSKSVIMSEDGSPTAFSLTLNALNEGDRPEHRHGGKPGRSGNQRQRRNSTGVTYTPNADYFGSDSFVVKVDDGNGGSDTITVNVTVQSVNDAPSIIGGRQQSGDHE